MYILPRKGRWYLVKNKILLFNKLLLSVPVHPRTGERVYVPWKFNLNFTYIYH